jgi:hypothetical protein
VYKPSSVYKLVEFAYELISFIWDRLGFWMVSKAGGWGATLCVAQPPKACTSNIGHTLVPHLAPIILM